MIKQILFYTRPWEVNFHIELSNSLKKEFPGATIRFVTFFNETHKYLKRNNFDSFLFTNAYKVLNKFIEVSDIENEVIIQTGFTLNQISGMERFLPNSRSEANIFVNKHLTILDELVTDQTLSISSMYDHFIYLIGGILANSRNGFHFALLTAGMPSDRIIALKTPWETWENSHPISLSETLLSKALKKMELPVEERISYMRNKKVTPVYKRILKTIREYTKAEIDFKRGNYFYSLHRPLLAISNNLMIRYRKLFDLSLFFDINTNDDLTKVKNQFIFCPLHMEPEATILMYSPYLRDQIELCRIIAEALPVGVKLLIKENPKMKNIRKVSFYKKIRLIPHALLVSPNIESSVLINNSVGVISLAGNASLEAAVLGKHNMCFASPPFGNVLEYCNFYKGFNLSELTNIIKEWVNSPYYSINKDEWHRWINGTFNGNLSKKKNRMTGDEEIIPDDLLIKNSVDYIVNVIESNNN